MAVDRCLGCGKVLGCGSETKRPYATIHTRRLMQADDPHADVCDVRYVCSLHCWIGPANYYILGLPNGTKITFYLSSGEKNVVTDEEREEERRAIALLDAFEND